MPTAGSERAGTTNQASLRPGNVDALTTTGEAMAARLQWDWLNRERVDLWGTSVPRYRREGSPAHSSREKSAVSLRGQWRGGDYGFCSVDVCSGCRRGVRN